MIFDLKAETNRNKVTGNKVQGQKQFIFLNKKLNSTTMNRIQKNKQMMGNSVTETLDANQALWQGIPVFANGVQQHKDNMAAILNWETRQSQAMDIPGMVRDKNLLRSIMVPDTLKIIGAIKAFAASTGNNELAASVNFNKSKLAHSMSDGSFLNACIKVRDVATTHAASITPYGVTPQFVTDYSLDITAFQSIQGKPKSMRGTIKMYTANLKEAVKTMLTYLKDSLDNMVRGEFTGSEIEIAYFNSRVTYDYGNNATGLKGTISNAETGTPVKAIVEMVGYPTPESVTVRSTNKKGNYAYKKVNATSCTIRVRATGFTTAEFTVTLEKDKFKDFDIQLMPEQVGVPA